MPLKMCIAMCIDVILYFNMINKIIKLYQFIDFRDRQRCVSFLRDGQEKQDQCLKFNGRNVQKDGGNINKNAAGENALVWFFHLLNNCSAPKSPTTSTSCITPASLNAKSSTSPCSRASRTTAFAPLSSQSPTSSAK